MSIYLHKHHIVPRHAGGTDDPSNLVELTVEDHAIAHKVLYGFYKREYDRIAWMTLSGQIDKKKVDPLIEEERRKKISRGMRKYFSTEKGKQQKIRTSTGRKLSQKSKDLISEKNGGNRNGMFGKNQTQEARDKIIKAQTGTRCYNNGLRNIRCRPENKPDGYVPGWLPRK